MRVRLPLRQFMSILKLWIKGIDRTSPYMRLMEMVIFRKRLPGEEFNRGKKGVFSWKIIPKIDGMFHCLGP
jgi:hypothetical protein